MKKTILSLLAIGFMSTSFAQVTIALQGTSTDISGTSIDYFLDPSNVDEQHTSFDVKNVSGAGITIAIERLRLDSNPTWTDYLCFGVTCYGASQMPTNPWTSPDQFTLADNEAGLLLTYITPNDNGAAIGRYRYYVVSGGQRIDSIDVNITKSLGVNENKITTSLSIAPNPANEFVSVTIDGAQTSNVKIVDVLGNIVYAKQVNSSTKIDVADLRNGVYFVTIEGDNKKTITKKLVVKH